MADAYHNSPSPSIFSKYKLLDAPPDTLGAASLHHANIVILIEDSVRYSAVLCNRRDDLYRMLPANMRAEQSERLPPIKSLTSSVLDIAAERKVAVAEIAKWLAPFAHNTKKRHSCLLIYMFS
ncbi:hypothetical protein ACLB2K_069890 [Fragaria x ananassa]